MKKEYIITNEEMTEKGLDLNEYALDGTKIPVRHKHYSLLPSKR